MSWAYISPATSATPRDVTPVAGRAAFVVLENVLREAVPPLPLLQVIGREYGNARGLGNSLHRWSACSGDCQSWRKDVLEAGYSAVLCWLASDRVCLKEALQPSRWTDPGRDLGELSRSHRHPVAWCSGRADPRRFRPPRRSGTSRGSTCLCQPMAVTTSSNWSGAARSHGAVGALLPVAPPCGPLKLALAPRPSRLVARLD
jgi:hypothetical protein